ncbi:protein RST1 [Impatiens glandulifera]|uniref:protein RST1 n=1 Tax=Impatiens glandulifera TaxID=253017 RepID=UPI001FB0E3B0|nr:protein RST1 [Impatiens glandulifera]
MDSYSSMLERTRVPQPSLQKYAVISIFDKLRSAPPYLNADSNPGRDVISQCLQSSSSAVLDQSVREICRFVKAGNLDISRGLMELQSALEGCDPRFVDVFVKSIGYLVRFGFQKDTSSFRFSSPEYHPFVKVFSCRTEVQSELIRQVIMFIVQNKQFGMAEVCSFLKPFLNFVVIKMPFSISLCTFLRGLIASMASVCCSFDQDAIPVIKLLMGCLSYIPCKSEEEFRNIVCLVGYLFDAYTVVLRHLVGIGLPVHEVQLCGVELLEVILSICTKYEYSFVHEYSVEVSKQLIYIQKELGLSCLPELSSLMLSLFTTLIQSEIEHEQLSILKLLLFFTNWRNENGNDVGEACDFSEELLFIFPVINLVSSPSKSVKSAAINLLSMTEKHLIRLSVMPHKETRLKKMLPSTSRPKDIAFRLLQHLWFQEQPSTSTSFLLSFCFDDGKNVNNFSDVPKTWTYLLKEYCMSLVEKKKSSLPISPHQESFLNEMPLLLGTIASILVMHPSLVYSAVDFLSVSSIMDPKLGVSLLLTILFYNHLQSGVKDINLNRISPKLLGLLPSLASHPTMVPLVVQAITPMLQDVGKPVLYASALRLLCKTWETNARAFGSLQKVLQPKHFDEPISNRTIYISMAASVRDVCRKDADRGVDLILSVSACIESSDTTIQALGFQSLSYLCEADVIDFYSAWDVIVKHDADYLSNPLIAHSICLLLKWGAMDAEAYPESASQVLQILWKIGTTRQDGPQWAKARASSFNALACYEVEPINKSIPDIRRRNMEVFTTETDPEVLRAMEAFEVKFISYEHMTRKRFVREKRSLKSKIEKLLNVSSQAIFASGNVTGARELPGAALFCLPLPPPIDVNVRGLQDVHAKYENMLVEIAASLQLSRNILIALISLQSWRIFIQRWMRDLIMHIDSKGPSNVLDKTSRAAETILKSLKRIAEESVPRSAENVALAIGAFCEALPPSAHLTKATASRFLLDWLFQQEHEHRQWSAAISLGLISSCLHVTDIKQKLQNVDALIEVASESRSTLVRGACGVGLGILCQNLLMNIDASSEASLHGENYRLQEVDLLGRSLRALSGMLCQYTHSARHILDSLDVDIFLGTEAGSFVAPEQFVTNESSKEEIWGVAGLVLGLGSCIGSVYRAGAFDVVEKIKTLILSWIPLINPPSQDCSTFENCDFALSVGSCLTLPVVTSFCLRVELMDVGEVDQLINNLKEFLSQLLSTKNSSSLHQSLLMASCAGSGNLIAFILSDGVHTLQVGVVKEFLELWRRCYIDPHSPLVCLGGMLGIVNALGAYAGTSKHHFRFNSLPTSFEQKGSTHVMGPLLSSLELEPQLTSLVQEMFLLAQNSKDQQLQHYASWTISLLRHQLWSQESQNVDGRSSSDAAGQRSGSQNIASDTVVMELSLWVMHLKNTVDGSFHVNTVATVLQCLSKAPRLPVLDWGGIIRRCMIHDNKIEDIARERNLREVCLEFSFTQASHFDSLLSFIDELSELSRFGRLELNLQACILEHLADLVKVFSGSRVDKLFSDVAMFLSSLVSNNAYNREHKSFLNVSTWKGLYSCLDDPSIDCHQNIERCIVYLFQLLPSVHHAVNNPVMEQGHLAEEWSVAIRCLTKARHDWVLDILKVTKHNLVEGDDDSVETLKKIQALARLFRVGFLKGVDIANLKTCLLSSRSHVIWDAQVEFVAALQHSEGSLRRQWLLDVVEICCVTKFPTTALQFLGLLCGSWCKYMPLLIVDPLTLLRDLPVTISSLLSESSWLAVAETVASCLWVSTERINDWVTKIKVDGNHVYDGSQSPIDSSENDMSLFLLRVLHDTCFCLKDHLSSDKQLKLANMRFPESS